MEFQLSNKQRKYLGLEEVQVDWDLFQLNGETFVYFNKDRIVKKITCNSNLYHECELDEKTIDRKILLPKTGKGKEKKLNYTTISSVTPIGIYFVYSPKGGVSIASYDTQTTFYSTYFEEATITSFDELSNWLEDYIKTTKGEDLHELEKFKKAKRKNISYKEGDFFRFKVDRRNYGFGRVLLDVGQYKKSDTYKLSHNYGLSNLMGKAIVVKIYHIISRNKETDLIELKSRNACPSEYIMDNRLFYGEYEIIGNLALEDKELDFPISYSKSIKRGDDKAIYIQWGKIYIETTISKFDKYLKGINPFIEINNPNYLIDNPYRKEGTGFSLHLKRAVLDACIKESSNHPFWETNGYFVRFDLRNPFNHEIKKEIFDHFGLNPDAEYSENF
ncbi:MAG: immunity 26/phosphotriesterase HocA family protein [Chitinophagales bacterium]